MDVLKKRLFLKSGLFVIFLAVSSLGFSQDAYMADTSENGGIFKNFLGVKLFAGDFGATSLNQDLQFMYVSNNPIGAVYHFQHDMNVTGINNFYNLGLGMEENHGKHLSINFFNASVGVNQHVWNWNLGVGAGYFFSLNKPQTMRLNLMLNINYQYLTYSFGDYYDTTQLGFFVDGVNIGTSVKNVKYVNDIFTVSPGLELNYRRPKFDYFVGVYYNYVFSYAEKVNFYVNSVPVSEAIYYPDPNPKLIPPVAVSRDIVNMKNYIIQIGIMREFGL